MQFAARLWQIAPPPLFYDDWALPKIWASMSRRNLTPSGGKLHLPRFTINGRSHLKQFVKTLIQAIRIEFPNLSNPIRQKVRLVALPATILQGIYREWTGADSPLEGGRTLLYYNIHHGDCLKIRMDNATFSYTSLQHLRP